MKKREVSKKRGRKGTNKILGNKPMKIILVLLLAIILLSGFYYFNILIKKCEDKTCFSEALIKCKRVSYIENGEEAAWGYSIKGKQQGECDVNVQLLQTKKGKTDMENIEGKEMSCSLPLGVLTEPSQNLEFCTGKLKEGLQDLIIKRMHTYIFENLEGINKEITGLENIIST